MLNWLKSLSFETSGALPKIAVVPGTPVAVYPSCGSNPCFVCKLRSTIEGALLRHPDYKDHLKADIEEREKKIRKAEEAAKMKIKAKKGAKGPPASLAPPPPKPAAPLLPFDLHIVGLRLEKSVSDAFDDRMVVFCRLPSASEAADIEKAVGNLLESLKEAAKPIDDRVRVVTCSGGSWLVALFKISTDPGLAKTAADLDAKIAAARRKAEATKKEKDLERLEAAEREKEALDLRKAFVDDGWVDENRGMMLPGFFPEAYTFRIHHGGRSLGFSKEASLAALTTGNVHALRMCTARYIREKHGLFGSSVWQVRELRGQKTQVFENEKAVLAVSRRPDKKWIAEVKIPSKKEPIALDDTDVLFLYGTAGGTNIHRAHNATLKAGAKRLEGGEPSSRVKGWSQACQVFPDWKEFNFFITLCAVAKRWKCAHHHKVEPGKPSCAILEAKDGEELGAGEKAVKDFLGESLLGRCADKNRREREGSKGGPVSDATATINELTWTDENEVSLRTLQAREAALKRAGKALPGKGGIDLKGLLLKRARKLTPEQQARLTKAKEAQAKWRRDFLREKTKRLAADHLRICDVKFTCNARFSYALVELNTDELAALENSFKGDVNKTWSGKIA